MVGVVVVAVVVVVVEDEDRLRRSEDDDEDGRSESLVGRIEDAEWEGRSIVRGDRSRRMLRGSLEDGMGKEILMERRKDFLILRTPVVVVVVVDWDRSIGLS